MKIALQTSAYWPRVGGIETVARLLAQEFAALGHSPIVITNTPGDTDGGVEVLRQAALARRVNALREADVVLMFGMSLRFLPLPALLLRPTVVSHHTWYDAGVAATLKRRLSRFTRNIAASSALADALGVPATIIGNPYDERVFRRRPEVRPTRDFVFVGRLVSDKGLDVLVEALVTLSRAGQRPMLTVVGSGPEEQRCRGAAVAGGVERQIEWAGCLSGDALAAALNRHRVLVVPSVWNEPFGIVALEGLACGCSVVGSSGGGLPEAIGPGGRTFPNGDAGALAEALRKALADEPGSAAVEEHLRRHSARPVAQRYLEVLREAAAR